MAIPQGVDARTYHAPEEKNFTLVTGETLHTLDDLSEAINLIEPEPFYHHVHDGENHFADWVQHVFGEDELATQLRDHPTPLRMIVAIERFLRDRSAQVPAAA